MTALSRNWLGAVSEGDRKAKEMVGVPENQEELMGRLKEVVTRMVSCVEEARDPRALDAKLIKQITETEFGGIVKSCIAAGINLDVIRTELQPLVDIGYLKERK